MSQEDRLTGLVGYSGMKVPVRVATTAAITLSGEQTIDGVACVTDDRVLVKDQSDTTKNGIYVVDTGDWERSADADGPYDFTQGSLVPVYSGTTNGASILQQTTADPEPGTTALTFTAYPNILTAPVSVANGGTGGSTAATARTNLGTPSTSDIQNQTQTYYTTGGTATAFTLTPSPAITAYTAGQKFSVKFNATAGAAPTLSISSVATPPNLVKLLPGGTFANIVAGDFQANHVSDVILISAAQALVTTLPNTFASKAINGLTWSNNGSDATNDIDIATGGAMDSTGAYWMALASAITKRIDAAWAVGTGNGGLMSAAALTNQVYGIWLIARSDTGVVDAGFDASLTSPTMPANYDYKRLIGWIQRVSNALRLVTITETAGGGIRMQHSAPPLDVDSTALTTSRLLSALPSAPLGIKVFADLNIYLVDVGGAIANIRSPEETDAAPSATASPGVDANILAATGLTMNKRVLTNTSGQIAARADAAVDSYRVFVIGYEWGRR